MCKSLFVVIIKQIVPELPLTFEVYGFSTISYNVRIERNKK